MSPRWNWDSPTPLAASECALPPDQRVVAKGVGESQFQGLEKRLALCLLCVLTINVPLFKKLRDIIFFWWENHFMSHFEGHFEGAKTFLTP
jgi:hypothetical protein